MKKSTIFSLVTVFVLIPATLYLGSRLPGRWYYLTSTLIILELMLPFFFAFERKRPQPRELVTIAVMAALAAASRAAFIWIPHFKPITGIIMITGIALGPQAGFLTGAVAAFASNFIFGQGPWTPWQMFAYGIGGFMAGILFYKKGQLGKTSMAYKLILTAFAFFCIVLIVGPLLDCSHIFTAGSVLTWEFALAVLASGLPVNLIHASAAALTVFFFSRPLLDKLERVQVKYGMMEN